MAIGLCIDTSSKNCSVSIFENENLILCHEKIFNKLSHSEKLNKFIDQLMKKSSVNFSDIDYYSVTSGPGSFTGLRIAAATAKAFCYVNKKPLISVPTTVSMSEQVIKNYNKYDFFCPVIDAKGKEIYFTIFDHHNNLIRKTKLVTLDLIEKEIDREKKYLFYGDLLDNIDKFKNIDFLKDVFSTSKGMGKSSIKKFLAKEFENLEIFEPNYLKKFITK